MLMIKGIIEKKMILRSTRRANGWQFGYRGKTGIGDWHCYFQIKTGNYHAEWGKKKSQNMEIYWMESQDEIFQDSSCHIKIQWQLGPVLEGLCLVEVRTHIFWDCMRKTIRILAEKKVPLTIILLFERNITRRYSIEDNNQTLLMRVVRLIAKKTKARIFSVFMD